MLTAKVIADAFDVPLAYLYCEDEGLAALLLALHKLDAGERTHHIEKFLGQLTTA